MHHARKSIAAATLALLVAPAAASDLTDVTATVTKWLADFNKRDMPAFIAACAPHAAVIDGFPPYAWGSCADWMAAYAANNAAIDATPGRLAIGKPVYSEVARGHAYLVYPATFTDTQGGKPVTYTGTWTITLDHTAKGWRVTGSGSAWGGNYTVRAK